MYFRNVQNCEKIGICVIDVNLWWGVGGGVLVGCWWGVDGGELLGWGVGQGGN